MRKFSRIPKMVVFRRAGAPSYLVPVYCALSDYAANGTGLCWPKMSTLADTLGISVRSVQRHISALVRLGLVELVERRRSARGRFSSWCYRLTLMAGFSKAATTGHGRRAARGPSNVSGTKRQKNTPQTPQIRGEEGARRRRSGGYGWLFGDDEGDGAK